MKDSILAARIDALERHLQPPEAPKTWPQTFPQAHVNDRIWEDLTLQMTRERLTRANELRALRERLRDAPGRKELERLWGDYAKVYNASQDIFRESREIMGGLAFREKNSEDARLCQIAEDIVLDCTRNAGTIPSLPVPGHEVVSRTLARVVRMRLPEWTLWTLPLVAHEYGKVVLDEWPAVAELIDAQHASFAARSSGDSSDASLERAKYDLRSLLADAFAAYTMGPAYGYAAVTLALNPADRALASRLRAEVICAVLGQGASRNRVSPFAKEVEYLRTEWRTLQQRVGTPGRMGKQAMISDLLDAIADDVYELRYPMRKQGFLGQGEHGYSVAQKWAEEWINATGHELPSPSPTSAASSIRDVLNAAWLARIEVSKPNTGGDGDGGLVPQAGREEEIVQRIEKAALALCEKIMKHHAPPAGSVGPVRTDGGPG
jgi:hypothetical protein